jgi:hypothetical protein
MAPVHDAGDIAEYHVARRGFVLVHGALRNPI